MIALSNSIHLYARPETKEKFLEFFTGILGLQANESSDAQGSPQPIYAFKFRCSELSPPTSPEKDLTFPRIALETVTMLVTICLWS